MKPKSTATTTKRYKALQSELEEILAAIPSNLITEDSTGITPEMLPLITLSQSNIDAIIAQVHGGVANIQDIYGLSPLQNGMLHHYLMVKEGDPYLRVSQLHFNDQSSLERYTDALRVVIERHDIFRTAFYWDGLNEPAQVVLRRVSSILTTIDVKESNKPVLEHLIEEFNPHRYRLDLTQAPLLRLMAAPTSEGGWAALQLIHNFIFDRSTLKAFETEIHAIMNGKIELLATPAPFRSFMAHARMCANSDEYTPFFTEMLRDIEEPTLPFGLSNVGQEEFTIDEAHLKLSQTLDDQLRAHARNLQVSLARICHLAWAQVVSRASGQNNVVFGTVLFDYLHAADGKNIIMGPTINTLPLRLNIDDRNVETTVRDTHAHLTATLAHGCVPLVLLQRCSGVSAGLPLFSALITYRYDQKTGEVNTLVPGVTFLGSMEQAIYPLTLSVNENDRSLCLSVQVISSISATRVCAYMQQSLSSLVDALAHAPQKSVQSLTVMPPEESTLLLHTWNQTTVDHSPCSCLHQFFEAQVECDGQAIAVEFNGQSLSYSELNIQANRLAHYLIAHGIKPDTRIVLCAERSIALIVGMLGILKAGGVYVPIDPAYSSQRLTNILLDADPILLLTDATGFNAFGDHHIPMIELGKSLPSDLPTDNPDTTKLGLKPTHLAYIIYTSGSTGTPKGVMTEHHQIVRRFVATHDTFGFSKQDKWCLIHSISFIASFLWEIWSTLYYGGKLYIATNDITRSTYEFYDWICDKGITVLAQTSSAFKIFLQIKNCSSRSDSLRCIIFVGEALDPSIVKEWREKYPESRTLLFSVYGSTEILSATYHLKESTENVTSIGRPTQDYSVYLLDLHGELALLGADGEIYISGARITRGYLNRPELTAERFLPDPFNGIATARMYRTGDLARYLPDSNLVFLGRADQQVKIRGFRIELGEIEARLVEHPQVKEAAVQCFGNGLDAHLVAYVVATTDGNLAQDLRTYLLSLLPDYMVPAAYVSLPTFPRTLSGKLIRRALPAPNDESFAHQQYEAPQGEMEEKLADIWRDLLSIDRISRHDNFFALGGNSLLAVTLLAKLRQIGLDTNVREMFDSSTLAMLASTLIHYQAVTIPPNLITKDTTKITPEMLPLIKLSQSDIDAIIAQVYGGVANIQDIYGLTPLQSGMLYHHLMAKEGDPYLSVSRLRFIDRTSLECYVHALQQTIERHDIFRTAILWDGLNEPVQVVLRRVPSLLSEISVKGTDESILEKLSEKFNPYRYRIDLTQAPLLRLLAAPTSENNWVAVQLWHHTTHDRVTVERLQVEIHTIMNCKIELLATHTPFRNFVAYARMGANSDEYMRFFTEMLGDIDEPTLPFGLRDVDQDGSDTNKIDLKLPQSLYAQLRAQARNFQVSLASICHLAWAQVLAKACGRDAIVFGTVLLGRLQIGEGNNNVLGPMINTLPIRLNIDERNVETAVRDAHTTLSSLLAHEHAPLVLAQSCGGISTGSPLFSALLNYRRRQNTKQVSMQLPGVSFLDSIDQINYPLELSLDDDDDSLCLSARAISPVSADRICSYMQQSFESLSDALINRPKQPIQELKVLPPRERSLLLHGWNQAKDTHAPVCCLHQVFESLVERDGDANAVKCEKQILSYAKLNYQANQLAHYLVTSGVRPDDRIAICFERSTAMIISILGILKAGCAYVPLDPAYTSQRLINILHDADPIFLLTDATAHKAIGNHSVPVIDLEKLLPINSLHDNPDANKLGISPANLAYVIYTSGSTGKPKGVMIEHRQAIRLFQVTHDKFDFNKQDKWCLFHSVSFDVSVWEIWGALSHGSQLLIVPYNTVRSAEEFCDWVFTNYITVLCQTPSAFRMIMRSEHFSSQSNQLRYIIFAGEELSPSIAIEWLENNKKCKTILVNMYGTTETTVHATFQRVENVEDIYSVGRPLSDLHFYLLDSIGDPVPLGAEGEIYISGAGVARGYLNRPDLTAERFLPDPFTNDPTARMYRTGDLARYLSDGNMVFLGRADQQMKIRGFRIELGEIEARLKEYPGVQEAVVQSYGDGSNLRLVAYVVAISVEFTVKDLRTYLLNLLPDYMVPAAYICLPSLPLTPNGKLDRRALPAPDEDAVVRQQYEAPQGETEEILAEIWCEILNIGSISRHDNFFALGGNSLILFHLVNKAKLNKVHIDARDVYSFPILKNLAEQITNNAKRSDPNPAIPVRQCGNEPPLFLLPGGMGTISYAFEMVHDIDESIPIYVLPWPSPDEEHPSSIEDMAKSMITHIKAVRMNGPCSIAGYSAGGLLAYEITRQLISTGYPVSFLGLFDTYAPRKAQFSGTKIFLRLLRNKYPVFEKFDSADLWWNSISELTLSESIEEIRKTNLDLSDIDIGWEALLAEQSLNYQNICEALEVTSLPMTIHLFKVTTPHTRIYFKNDKDNLEKAWKLSKLGWDEHNLSTHFKVISVDGDHYTMMRDPKFRTLLAKKLTQCLLQKI